MAAEPVIRLRQVRRGADVLNDTFRLLRQNYAAVGKSLLFIVGPVVVLSSMSGAMIQLIGFTFSPDVASQAEIISSGVSLLVMVLVAVVFSITAGVLAVAVVNGAVVLYQDRGPGGFDVRDVWMLAKARFWKILGTVLLLGLCFAVSLVIVFIPCLGGVGYLVGAVYFAVALSPLFAVLVREETGIIDGIRRSRYLVKGHWWPTFGVLAVAGLIYLLMGTVFTLPYYVALFVTGLHTVEAQSVSAVYSLLLVGTSVLASVGSTLLYSIPLTAASIQYFSLVEHKERTGLLAQIEALEAGAAEAPPPPFFPADGFGAAPGEGAAYGGGQDA